MPFTGRHRLGPWCAALLAMVMPGAALGQSAPVGVAVEVPDCYGTMSVWQGGQIVRAGPSFSFGETDRLAGDTLVTVCERRGMWRGIVYATERPFDCGLDVAGDGVYAGRCRSGWIPVWALSLFAG